MSSQQRKNTGLGKGLSALIPTASLTSQGTLKDEGVTEIPIASIRPNPFQPRKDFDEQALDELKRSIQQNGIIQPITVRKTGEGYELIAGERRWRASKLAGLRTLPAYVREGVTDDEMLELAIIENVQREMLNPIELAEGYVQLMEQCRLTQDQVAHKIGKDRTTIANIVRLLKLPSKIQDSLRKEEITIGHGRALIALPSADVQVRLWQNIVAQGMSVRKTEESVRKALAVIEGKSKTTSERTEHVSNPHLDALEDRLRLKFATKVKIRHREDGGTVEIEYYSVDDLDRLFELFDSIPS